MIFDKRIITHQFPKQNLVHNAALQLPPKDGIIIQ